MPKIGIEGTELKYIERGEGEPVVLVHGTLGDYRSWELQMEPFAKNYRVISYSRRYHHPNTCAEDTTSGYSAALHADDLAAFLSGLGLDTAHIVGNSYGAYTALFLALRHPARVRSLVLGEPPVFPLLDAVPEGRDLRDKFIANVWKPAGEILQRGAMEDGVRLFVDGVAGEGAFDSFPDQVRTLIMDNACEFKKETSSPDFWTQFTREDARGITGPTLLLTGEKSLRMFQLIVKELGHLIPNNELIILPDSTHEMPADNPKAYNEVVLSFLGKHSE